jgi:hypothetical protein
MNTESERKRGYRFWSAAIERKVPKGTKGIVDEYV